MAPGYDGSVKIDTRINTKGFNTGIKSMSASMVKLGIALGIAFGVGAMVNYGKVAVDTAGQAQAAWIGLQSIIEGQGRSFTQAKKFIEDYISDGLIPMTNAVAAYKNLAMRGYDTGQIETTMIALKNASAFGRQASLTMGQAVQSATEGLKNENSILVDNAGVTKNVSMMWKDYAASIGTTVGNLTKQQKIQAEVNGILEETRFQGNDAAKMTGGYAGKIAALGTSLYNLKVAFGSSIIPIVSSIIPILKAAVDQLVIFFNMVAQIMAALFGVQLAGAAQSMEELSDGTNAAADAQQNLGDQTAASGKAAKGALAAFDQLNVLQMDSGEAGGGGEGAGGGISIPVVEPEETESAFDQIGAKVEELKAKLLAFFGPLQEPFERLKEAAKVLGGQIWDGLKWVWENILVPVGKWLVQAVAPVALDIIAASLEILSGIIEALKPFGLWLWENFLQPIAEWTGGVIVTVLTGIADALTAIGDWIRDHQKAVETIAIVIGSFAVAWWLVNGAIAAWNIIGGIAAGVTTAFGAAVAFLTSPVFLVVLAVAALIAIIILLIRNWDDVKRIAGEVWDWIVEKWGIAAEWFRTKVIEPISKWFDRAWKDIKEWAVTAWNNIKNTWSVVKEWFKTNVTDPVKNWFKTSWEDIKGFFTGAWDAIKKTWGVVSTWFTENVTGPIKEAFRVALDWVKEKWETIFGGLKDFTKNSVNTIIDFVNAMIRAVALGINAVIKGLNSIKVTIPAWIPVIGGNSWGLSIPEVTAPQIPRLAKGAVIPANSEFLAILGDQRSGKNIETPESLLRQIVSEEIGKIQADIQIDFTGRLGGLVRELEPYIRKESVRVGGSLIAVKGGTP